MASRLLSALATALGITWARSRGGARANLQGALFSVGDAAPRAERAKCGEAPQRKGRAAGMRVEQERARPDGGCAQQTERDTPPQPLRCSLHARVLGAHAHAAAARVVEHL